MIAWFKAVFSGFWGPDVGMAWAIAGRGRNGGA